MHAHMQRLPASASVDDSAVVCMCTCVFPLCSWVNSPWTSSLEEDIFKAANMLRSFTNVGAGRGCQLLLTAARVHANRGWPKVLLLFAAR